MLPENSPNAERGNQHFSEIAQFSTHCAEGGGARRRRFVSIPGTSASGLAFEVNVPPIHKHLTVPCLIRPRLSFLGIHFYIWSKNIKRGERTHERRTKTKVRSWWGITHGLASTFASVLYLNSNGNPKRSIS